MQSLPTAQTLQDWVAVCYQNRTSFLSQENLPNCLVTTDFGGTKECFKCETGYTYDNDYHCITLNDAKVQGICSSLTGAEAGTDECSYCDDGKDKFCPEGKVYVKENASCVPAIPQCDNYDCDGKCLECVNGYYLAQDKNVCVKAIDHCVDYESTGHCKNCQADQVEVTDDICCPEIKNCTVYADTCAEGCSKQCEDNQVENHNQVCVDIIPHCQNQHDNGVCNYCENGWQLAIDNNRVCVAEMPHCAEYVATGDCEECDDGQQLVQQTGDQAGYLDKCVKKIDNCEEQEYTDETCVKCINTHELAIDANVCVPEIPNCDTYHSSGVCFKCKNGYLKLSPTSCHADLPRCTNYQCNGACESCEHGYVQISGKCSTEVPQCTAYKPGGECSECESEYSLSGSECKQGKSCASFNCEGVCIKCEEGFNLTEYNVCTGATTLE